MIFDRKKLHLAEIKYFDIKRNGIELTDPASMVIIYGDEGNYLNPLCHCEEFPTFKRSRVPNYNGRSDEYFGTKVIQLTEECSTGPCWLIRDKDDFEIAKRRLRNFERPFAMTRIIRRDKEDYAKYCEFFDSRKSDLSREFIKR